MKNISVRKLSTADAGFEAGFSALLHVDASSDPEIARQVAEIVGDVRARGDEALLELTNRFDRRRVASAAELELDASRLAVASARIGRDEHAALEEACERIEAFHTHQLERSWRTTDAHGNVLGQQVTALERVGMYVPGGKAAYPSSVLMNAVPARVAGVDELIMTVPAPDGVLNDLVLAAAQIAGVNRVFTVGGAQAVAALAYGTAHVPGVDKIVGPGNAYVAAAKRMVFGQVGIDMIAGPSEVLIVCDGETDPDWIAMDLFAQAEHDENARAMLISQSQDYLDAVASSIDRLLPEMERATIIEASLRRHGVFIRVADLDEAVTLVNRLAPEHLELSVAEPERLLSGIRNAGAIFLGRYAAEAVGDYCAGPNHVLPTGKTARFSSPLGVYDFQKRSSIIECSPAGAAELARITAVLANGERLTAHARSASMRVGAGGPKA